MINVDIQSIFAASLPCSWRGIDFYVLDTRQSTGRRLQKLLYPGLDQPSFQDLGALDGPISVTGLLIGDDYVRQAEALRAAYRTYGPAALVLPWFTTAPLVALKEPAEISFSIRELRVARFSAQFELVQPYQARPLNPLEQLQAAIHSFEDQARAFIAGVLSPLQLPLALFGYAQRFAGYVSTAFTIAGALGGSGSNSAIVAGAVAEPLTTLAATGAIVATAVSAPLATLASTETDGTDAAWAVNMAAALCAVPEAAAAASVPTPPAAVAPGGSIVTPPAADPQATATMLLAAATAIGAAAAADPSPGPALAAAMVAECVVTAIDASSDIVWTSQGDATAWQAVLIAQLDAATAAVAAQCAVYPLIAGPVWRSLVDLRSALVIDMQAVIGRLPQVETLTVPRVTSAWLIAQYLVGDTPSAVIDTYSDLVARNKIYHPAIVPAGALEYLA